MYPGGMISIPGTHNNQQKNIFHMVTFIQTEAFAAGAKMALLPSSRSRLCTSKEQFSVISRDLGDEQRVC